MSDVFIHTDDAPVKNEPFDDFWPIMRRVLAVIAIVAAIVVVLFAAGFYALSRLFPGPDMTRPCVEYANVVASSVPARCVGYFQGGQR